MATMTRDLYLLSTFERFDATLQKISKNKDTAHSMLFHRIMHKLSESTDCLADICTKTYYLVHMKVCDDVYYSHKFYIISPKGLDKFVQDHGGVYQACELAFASSVPLDHINALIEEVSDHFVMHEA